MGLETFSNMPAPGNIKVKNTFLDVRHSFVEEDADAADMFGNGLMHTRQFSEPAPRVNQFSQPSHQVQPAQGMELQHFQPPGTEFRVQQRMNTSEDLLPGGSMGMGRQVTDQQWPEQPWPESWGTQPGMALTDLGQAVGMPVPYGMANPSDLVNMQMVMMGGAPPTQGSATGGPASSRQMPVQEPVKNMGQAPMNGGGNAGCQGNGDMGQSWGCGGQSRSRPFASGTMPCLGDPKLAQAALQAAQDLSKLGPDVNATGVTGGTQPPAEWQSTTTVMVRNIPNKYNQQLLLEDLNNAGFSGTYDFLYLPIDPETIANRGYAFINFVDPSYAWMLRMTFEGQKMGKFNSDKVVSVAPAALQGFEANYAHYSTARVNRGDPATRPLFLRESCMPHPRIERRRGGRRSQGSLVDIAARQQLHHQQEASGLTGASNDGQGQGQPNTGYYIGIRGSPVAPGSVAGGKRGNQHAQQSGPTHQQQQMPQMQQMQQMPQMQMQQMPQMKQMSQKQFQEPANQQARFCQSCGGKAQSEFRFCQFCGSPLAFHNEVWGA